MNTRLDRRQFLQRSSFAAAATAGFNPWTASAAEAEAAAKAPLTPKADAMILIWLPGGMAQTDLWDPKQHTPFRAGMKGSELLGTCPRIPTAADGIFLGEGLESVASVMDQGTLLRSLTNDTKFGAIHLKAQHYAMTSYLFPVGVQAPSIGSVIGRTLGRRNPAVPPYIYIGRDIDTSDAERLFISEYLGPGFYGVNHAPFMVPDPSKGMATLTAAAGMTVDRLDRRQGLLKKIAGLSVQELRDSPKAQEHLKTLEEARAMMDSPVKAAFDFAQEETPEVIAAYQPKIAASEQLDPGYFNGGRFGNGLLLARRLVERGARFVQVEYQYGPFQGFDMHENGHRRMKEMKRQIDGSIAQLIRDLKQRGLLERTLVCIMTEFGRTIASAPSAGSETEGFAERHTGEDLIITNEKMYGFHGHFSSCNCMTFFGGGFKKGYVHGKTAQRHPMLAVENPVPLIDAYATIYKALGIRADTNYVTEGRPFYVTKDGKGKPVDALLT